jgi:7,8-dihydropterin-6-yl-methyl-4-(beta-D-ribofuranosyl)aminobenzene 5'-phosphate synthase
MELIHLEPVDSVSVTTLIDNSIDILMPDVGLVKRWGPMGSSAPLRLTAAEVFEDGKTVDVLRAEHGYSALIELAKDGRTRRVLFDAGVTPDGLMDNLDRLAISPESLEAIVLSHGHFDHVAGMDGLSKRLGRFGLPVFIHPEFWTRRRIAIPTSSFELPVPSRSALEGAGFRIVEDRQPSFLLEGSLLITGEVDRTTDFETGMRIHQAWRGGEWQPDPLILDDQAAILVVRDKGLVVLTGCGHAGIVNIVRYAKKLTGVDTVYAVIGGFHLTGGLFEPIIPQTVAALAEFSPRVVVPAHCTGWKATQRIAAVLADAFLPGSVGTRYEL